MQAQVSRPSTSPAIPAARLHPFSGWTPVFQRKQREHHAVEQAQVRKEAPAAQPQPEIALELRSDFDLIDLALNGMPETFNILVTRYNHSIYALAYRMLRNHDDAADIAQEVFLKAYEALASFQKKSSFHTWVYRIATNSCINYLRKHAVQYHIEFAAYHAVQEEETLDALYKIELQDVVNEAIERLPEKQKATVMLRVCQGLSHREVSRILNCSVGTAKANYFHAIRNLRRFMRNYIAANGMEDIIPPSLLRAGGVIH